MASAAPATEGAVSSAPHTQVAMTARLMPSRMFASWVAKGRSVSLGP